VLTGHRAKRFVVENDEKILVAEFDGRDVRIPFDALLCAVGRVANTAGYGLERSASRRRPRAPSTPTSSWRNAIRTSTPAATSPGPYQFTHTAAHQAWYAAVNALFGNR
jgi:hypothetical protein